MRSSSTRVCSYVFAAITFLSGFAASSQRAQTPPPQAAPVRVRAKLSGFDLAPTAGHAPNQVGGASRGMAVVLYAPHEGKSYSERPCLDWSSEDPAYEFTLKIVDDDTGQEKLTKDVQGGHFSYPADSAPLRPGRTYTWTVEPKLDLLGGPASARIKVLGGAEREEIAAQLSVFAGSPDAQERGAKLFVERRIWFDAVAAYTVLIAQHPNDADLLHALSNVYASLPQTEPLAEAEHANTRQLH